MKTIKEVVVVEGRYDKNAIKQTVKATVLETSGFGIFNNTEKLALLRQLAESRGLILLTDSDGAGFVIRNYLKGTLPKDRIKQAYIPEIAGKESRKAHGSKAGTLGVEGMKPEVLLAALEKAGATFIGEEEAVPEHTKVTKADLYALGLSGRPDSAKKRADLIKKLGLPGNMTSNALLEYVNITMGLEGLKEQVK